MQADHRNRAERGRFSWAADQCVWPVAPVFVSIGHKCVGAVALVCAGTGPGVCGRPKLFGQRPKCVRTVAPVCGPDVSGQVGEPEADMLTHPRAAGDASPARHVPGGSGSPDGGARGTTAGISGRGGAIGVQPRVDVGAGYPGSRARGRLRPPGCRRCPLLLQGHPVSKVSPHRATGHSWLQGCTCRTHWHVA